MNTNRHRTTIATANSLESAVESLRKLIAAKQAARKHVTLPVEIRIDERGEVHVWVTPPKVQIA